jgi:hypothetical protein
MDIESIPESSWYLYERTRKMKRTQENGLNISIQSILKEHIHKMQRYLGLAQCFLTKVLVHFPMPEIKPRFSSRPTTA